MSNEDLLEVQRRLQRQHGITPPAPAHNPAAVAAGMFNMMAANAEKGREQDSEYMGEDGLLHCKVCNGPRQTIVQPPFEGAKPRTVRCWCSCPTSQDRAKEREKQVLLEQRLSVCFKNARKLQGMTFEADDGKRHQELVAAARQYAEQFPEHRRNGKGILYYGPYGTGKTFLAASIANHVLRQGYRAIVASIGDIADEMWAAKDKAAYMADICKYDLLILDDLGVERKSEYMQEMTYKIINGRVAAGLPVIITTNLTPDELLKTADAGYARTYDRLLEICVPTEVSGKSRRRAAAAQTWTDMRKQLGLEA